MNADILEKLENILGRTTKLSFSMLSNEKQKKKQLEEIKVNIEDEILSILGRYDSEKFKFDKEKLWKAAEKSAYEQFKTLPEKLKINSFYLQEVMHQYIELIISLLSAE